MTVLKYIIQSKICNTAELLSFKREHAADWEQIRVWAAEEMKRAGIPIDVDTTK